MEDKLLFALVYTKTYPLQVVQGQLFGMSQSSANEWIHFLLPVLATALDDLGPMPERDGAQVAQHERRHGDAPDLIVDGVERRRQRPKDPAKQAIALQRQEARSFRQEWGFGEHLSHRVSFLSPTLAGLVHDKLWPIVENSFSEGCHPAERFGLFGYHPSCGHSSGRKKAPED